MVGMAYSAMEWRKVYKSSTKKKMWFTWRPGTGPISTTYCQIHGPLKDVINWTIEAVKIASVAPPNITE